MIVWRPHLPEPVHQSRFLLMGMPFSVLFPLHPTPNNEINPEF